MYPFANSISELKNQPTVGGKLRANKIVWVLNAVTANKLSAYVFLLGNPTESLPAIVLPNDNAGNYYYQSVL